jgi:GTPase SAR1 family protein
MSYGNTIGNRIAAARQGTIAILEGLVEKANIFQLPAPPSVLEDYRGKLKANDYQVLVVGEAKRGKSTFVNALIGREILPTDVDVATCQVFRIRRAANEAYRIRFEDESQREITLADLPRYGSQTMADVRGLPNLNQIIRWIEVDLPAHFLPEGVSLLDTPGLGSLYSAHAQITQRFVPFADAVIFVLDSSQPIIQPELDFIDKILSKTPHILFIQTKIDLQRRENWQALLRRNQEILQERFGNRLTDTRVWPISSTNLLKAAQAEDDDDYLRVSRYRQLAAVLQVFLFRVAGWDRAAVAIRAAEDYYVLARKTLAGRLAAITEESEQKRAEIQRRIAQRKQQFDKEWGEYGQKQDQLIQDIRRVALAGKQNFLQELQQGGEIEMAQRARIDSLKSFEEAKQYSNVMEEQVIGALLEKWSQIRRQVFNQWSMLLGQFMAVANSLSFSEDTGSTNVVVRHARNLQVKGDWSRSIEEANKEADLVSTLVGYFLPSSIAKLAALGWTVIRSWIIGIDTRLENAKRELHQRLDDELQSIRQQFLGVDLRFGYLNHIDGFFDTQVRAFSEYIQKAAARKSAEAQVEIDRISEQARLDEQERKTRSEGVQHQLAEWDAISQLIKDIVFGLQILEQSLAMFSGEDL